MKADLIYQLRDLGLSPQEPAADRIYFSWTVPVGGNAGKKVLVGTMVDNNFPATCPSAPHFKPFDKNWIEHANNVSDSAFGSNWNEYPKEHPQEYYTQGWRYWSRGFDEWPQSDKNAKTYLAHLKKIMMTV